MATSMVHWNGNQVCVIDTETTGLDPNYHEIIQICILPLDSNFDVRKDIAPFLLELKPEHPERASREAMALNRMDFRKIAVRGIDPLKAIDLLESWIEKLKLPVLPSGNPRKIIPLGQNFAFDRAFMIKWLTSDQFNLWFHYHYRDTMLAATYLNDRAGMQGEKVPFSKVSLSWLTNKLDVPLERAHDALEDCLATAEVYKRLLQRMLVT